METKQYIALEVTKNDFTFTFQMQTGATWGSAIDAAFDVLEKLNELSSQSVKALKPTTPTEPTVMVEGD